MTSLKLLLLALDIYEIKKGINLLYLELIHKAYNRKRYLNNKNLKKIYGSNKERVKFILM